MKIIATSDLHGHLPKLPKCDVVCISGDILPLNIQNKFLLSLKWLIRDFRDWAESLDCKRVILIGGNHDFVLQDIQTKLGLSESSIDYYLWADKEGESKIIYLQDNSCEIDGKIFYGTPWCPNLRQWAFYKNSKDLKTVFESIPNAHIDVFLTHCPPKFGSQGKVLQGGNWNFDVDFGCEELMDILKEKDIDYVLSGHIHSGNHNIEQFGKTKFVNVSIKNEDYNVTYKPFEFNI